MIAMDDFTKIEVDKIFPGPVPDQEGVQIELWHDKVKARHCRTPQYRRYARRNLFTSGSSLYCR